MSFSEQTTYITGECITCGVRYAVTAEFDKQRKEDHQAFYCPNGHHMYYPRGTSQTEKLRKQLKAETERGDRNRQRWHEALDRVSEVKDELKHEQRRVNGYKGALARSKKGA
jgi:hypothetical protein